MAEQNVIDRLDELVEALLAGRETARPVVDADLAMLATVAADLRGLPDPAFRSTLRNKLVPTEEKMSTTSIEIKEGFRTVTPYFVVKGGDRFIEFLQRAFGATLHARFAKPDGSVMHAQVQIGDSFVELGDSSEQYKPVTMGIHLYVPDVDAVYERALRAGATSLYGLTDQAYGDREGSVVDPFGNHWYIATHQEGGWRPEGFSSVTLSLHPSGAGGMIDFLKSAFGAEELERTAAKDGSIMHATMRVGDSMVEMGEAHGQWQPMPANVHLYVDDADAFYDRAMKAGATSIFPVKDQPYGERSGGVTDPFGNSWYVATPTR
jgi:PhnB protein